MTAAALRHPLHLNLLLLLLTDIVRSEQDGKKDLVQPNEKHYDGVPKFLQEPNSIYYVNKTHPVTITCIAEPVSHVNIFCAEKQSSYMGEEISESGLRVIKMNQLDKPDSNGKRWKFSLSVKLKDVVEWFSEYKCHCEAWNQILALQRAKKVQSSTAMVQESYFQEKFKKEPVDQVIPEGHKLELSCMPPDAKPNAQVSWWKNDQPIGKASFPSIHIDDFKQLTIERIQKSDSGNYTCVAEHLGIIKKSKPAMVTVTSKYYWSAWTEWKKCPDECQNEGKCSTDICITTDRKKVRFCIYENSKTEATFCKGESSEIEPCNSGCASDNNWRFWSEWSISCAPNCIQTRHRRCDSGKCLGPKMEHRNCSQALCYNRNRNLNPDSPRTNLYLALFITIAVLFIIILIILCLVTQKGYISFITRRTIGFSNNSNDMKKNYGIKDARNNERLLNNEYKSTIVSIKNPNAQDIISTSLLSECANNYSPVYEMHQPSTRDHIMPAIYSDYPVISKSPYHYSQSTPLIGNGLTPERSFQDSAIDDQKSQPSALYQELSIGRGSCGLLSNYLPNDVDLDTVAWGTFSSSGGRLCLPQSGISLTIPRGVILHGNSEELFLAVSRDQSTIPVLDISEVMLSPVIICGPPSTRLAKPIILTLPHCAYIQTNNWNIRVLSARFQNSQIPPLWKEFATIRPVTGSDSHIFAQIDTVSAHIMTDQLQMICLTGRICLLTEPPVTIRLRVLAFSKLLSTDMDFAIRIHIIPDTKEAFENLVSSELKNNGILLDNSKKLLFSSTGGDLAISLDDISVGWRCKSNYKLLSFPFSMIWKCNHGSSIDKVIVMEQVDPSRSNLSCNVNLQQLEESQNQTTIFVRWEKSNPRSTVSISSESKILCVEFSQTYLDPLQTVFRLSYSARQKLWPLLDPYWQTLANHMSLNGNLSYFSEKHSPCDSILDLWEARCRDENAVLDLINSLRVIGRNDCAMIIEQDLIK